MGLRFRRSVRLSTLLKLNLSKSGVSVSMGKPGATVNVGTRGVTTSVGIPGTGLSYRSSGTAGELVIAALLAVLLFALVGCGTPGHSAHAWVLDPNRPKCATMTWRKVSFEEMVRRTGKTTIQAAAWGCDVLSVYSEEQAKQVNDDGESLWDHEARHVFEQMEHPTGGARQ